jgi:hypothetical protein
VHLRDVLARFRPVEMGLAAGENDHGAGLARDLSQVVSEPIFYIPRLVEAERDQRLDPLLGGRSPERSDARIPPGAKLDVRRQAGVDEALRLGDRPFVELAVRGIAMVPLPLSVIACEFAGALVFGLVLDSIKIPVFARLGIS